MTKLRIGGHGDRRQEAGRAKATTGGGGAGLVRRDGVDGGMPGTTETDSAAGRRTDALS